MNNSITLYRNALAKYMPQICFKKIVGLFTFAVVYLAAQTELGVASSGGIRPLVIATAVLMPFQVVANFCSIKKRVFALGKIERDLVVATVAALTTMATVLLLATNNELLAMRYFTMASLIYAAVYSYGFVHRTVLTDYINWPWRGLQRDVHTAGLIMALIYALSALVSEMLIDYGNVGIWVMMRVFLPVFALKIGHGLIIAHQLWLRRSMPVAG